MKNIGYSYNGFTEARLKRFLQTGGTAFTFTEVELNDYNEPTETVDKSVTVLGVLHKLTVTSQVTSSQDAQVGSKTRSISSTSIMTSWESLVDGYTGGKELSPEMVIEIDGSVFKIIKTENLNDWGIIAEISLEEYDGWKH